MRYNRIPVILTTLCLLAAGNVCRAQADSNVYNERVVVTSRYKPVVEETQKVNVAPTITDTVATMPKNLSYDITTTRLTSLYQPSRIKAARIKAGYTLHTAAAALGVRHQVIMAIEHPRRIKPIPDDVLQRLADAYGCVLAAFYKTGDKLPDG